MSSERFVLELDLSASPAEVCAAWLDEAAHSEYTGAPAQIDPTVGGTFTAWDGYISGTTQTIEAPQRIVQAWRTSEFADADPDSLLELRFTDNGAGGTRLTLAHSNIPTGQGKRYEQGWRDFYFEGMTAFFGNGVD